MDNGILTRRSAPPLQCSEMDQPFMPEQKGLDEPCCLEVVNALGKKIMRDAIEAVKLGLAARDFEAKTGVAINNPFENCSTDCNAFIAGLENDLMAWLEVRSEILGTGFGE